MKQTVRPLRLKDIVNKDTQQIVREGRKWAKTSAALLRSIVPVYTGNLRDSIGIIEENYNPSANTYSIRVGVIDSKILPPPYHKHVIRPGKDYGKYVEMPDFNYAPNALSTSRNKKKMNSVTGAMGRGQVVGGDAIQTWFRLSNQELEKMLKGIKL